MSVLTFSFWNDLPLFSTLLFILSLLSLNYPIVPLSESRAPLISTCFFSFFSAFSLAAFSAAAFSAASFSAAAFFSATSFSYAAFLASAYFSSFNCFSCSYVCLSSYSFFTSSSCFSSICSGVGAGATGAACFTTVGAGTTGDGEATPAPGGA